MHRSPGGTAGSTDQACVPAENQLRPRLLSPSGIRTRWVEPRVVIHTAPSRGLPHTTGPTGGADCYSATSPFPAFRRQNGGSSAGRTVFLLLSRGDSMSESRWVRAFLLTLIYFLCLGGRTDAGTISLFNTGVNSSGVPLAGGSNDPHWTIISGPGITSPAPAVVVSNQSPFGLYAQNSSSKWIWVNASGDASINSPYTIRETFNLTGENPNTAMISGSWGIDNTGMILLNGSTPLGTGTMALLNNTNNNFESFHSFTITGGFVAGVNTLDFVVTDAANPGALNVNSLVGTVSVPEPSALTPMLVGWIGVLAYRRVKAIRQPERVCQNRIRCHKLCHEWEPMMEISGVRDRHQH